MVTCWVAQFADVLFPAEFADYAHVVHDPTVPAFCLGALHGPEKSLIGQAPALLLFGLFLFL